MHHWSKLHFTIYKKKISLKVLIIIIFHNITFLLYIWSKKQLFRKVLSWIFVPSSGLKENKVKSAFYLAFNAILSTLKVELLHLSLLLHSCIDSVVYPLALEDKPKTIYYTRSFNFLYMLKLWSDLLLFDEFSQSFYTTVHSF